MSYREQKKLLEELKNYESKFSSQEKDEYKMFLKRQKDDEDFDTLSMKRLKKLYDKYYAPPNRSKLDALFKKKDEE